MGQSTEVVTVAVGRSSGKKAVRHTQTRPRIKQTRQGQAHQGKREVGSGSHRGIEAVRRGRTQAVA